MKIPFLTLSNRICYISFFIMILCYTGLAQNVGIGTATPATKLEVVGSIRSTTPEYGLMHTDGTISVSTYIGAGAGWIGTSSNHPLWFYTHDSSYPWMVIDTEGKIGIGTSSPSALFEVNGNAKINGRISNVLDPVDAHDVSTKAYVDFLEANDGWVADEVKVTTVKNVGIGTTTPSEKLHILGNQRIEGRLELLKSVGDSSLFIGTNAGINDDGGNENTLIGTNAGKSNTSGFFNTALGISVLKANTSGNLNTATGAGALLVNTIGSYNTSNGVATLYKNTTGYDNTAIGFLALYENTFGFRNSASGAYALKFNTTGSHNTALGDSSLVTNTLGAGNTGLGFGADVSSNNLINATAIGYKAIVDASNKVRIGNASVTVIEGQVPFSFSSDRRLKEDISPVNLGLNFINDLNPVQYHRLKSENKDFEMGIIAQELFEVLKKHGADRSGMINQSKDQYLSVRYNDLLAPLIKAVQELSAENKALKADNNQFRSELKRLDKLEASLASLKSILAMKALSGE